MTITGCGSDNGPCKGCETGEFRPNVDLKFVNPDTKQDLFFGAGTKFTANQIKIRHVSNTSPDSLPIPVKIDTVKHTFNIDLAYANDVDTLSVQVASLKPQMVYLGTGILQSCCTRVIITSVTYQDKLLYTAPSDPAKQAKIPNLVTVPFQLK